MRWLIDSLSLSLFKKHLDNASLISFNFWFIFVGFFQLNYSKTTIEIKSPELINIHHSTKNLILENSNNRTHFSKLFMCTIFPYRMESTCVFIGRTDTKIGWFFWQRFEPQTLIVCFIWIKPEYILYCALGDKTTKIQSWPQKPTVIYTIPVSHIPSEALKSDESLHLIHSNLEKKKEVYYFLI